MTSNYKINVKDWKKNQMNFAVENLFIKIHNKIT